MRLARIAALDAGDAPLARAPSAARVRRGVVRLLEQNVLCSIATVIPDGRAHINTAYFAYTRELDLYFLSHPESLHCRNLEITSSCATTVFSSRQKWGENDIGLQLFGTGGQATGSEARKAERFYAKRFRAYRQWWSSLEPGDRAREYRFYRFRVRRLKLFDEKNFGGAVFVSAFVVRSSRRS